jgi:phage-related protein
VNFTAAQKEQIKNMQKSGNVLGAQKIILGEVENQVKGTAAATAGAGAKMSVAYEEMKVKLGTALLPAVGQVKTMFAGLFDFIAANSSWLVPLVGGIVAIVGALLIFVKTVTLVRDAVIAFKAVWLALNSSFIASPIGLIIIGIVALIAVIVIIATKTTWFQTIWNTVTRAMVVAWNATVGAIMAAWNATWRAVTIGFNFIRSIAMAVFTWIRGNWPALIGILAGPFGLAVTMIIHYWGPITGFFAGIVGAIGGVFSRVIGVITSPFITAFNIVKGIVDAALGGIRSAVSSVLSFVNTGISAAKATYNAFARTWNAIQVTMPGVDTHIPGIGKVGGFTLGLPDLPMLARGAYITRPTLGVIGEAGPELVLPERRLEAILKAAGGRGGPLVQIAHATFGERVDVDAFGKRLAWQIETAGV